MNEQILEELVDFFNEIYKVFPFTKLTLSNCDFDFGAIQIQFTIFYKGKEYTHSISFSKITLKEMPTNEIKKIIYRYVSDAIYEIIERDSQN